MRPLPPVPRWLPVTPWRPGMEHGMGQWCPAKRGPGTRTGAGGVLHHPKGQPQRHHRQPGSEIHDLYPGNGLCEQSDLPGDLPVKITPASTETHAPASGAMTISTAAAAALPPGAWFPAMPASDMPDGGVGTAAPASRPPATGHPRRRRPRYLAGRCAAGGRSSCVRGHQEPDHGVDSQTACPRDNARLRTRVICAAATPL